MNPARRHVSLLAGLLLLGVRTAPASADLRPDELLLLVNTNVPASAALAAQYAKARAVPEARILKLDSPLGEEIDPATFEAKIATPVRDYLKSPAGQGVRCLVTFYGLPLRVGSRTVSEAERAEVMSLRRLLADLEKRAADVAKNIDAAAALAGVTPPAQPVEGLTLTRQHIQTVDRNIVQALTGSPDLGRKQAVLEAMKSAQQSSIVAATETLGSAFAGAATAPETPPEQNAALANRPRDADARAALRVAVARQGGVFPLAQIADQQFNWINAEESDAAVDSELALVRSDDFFRYRWQPNPLHWRAGPAAADQAKVLMVARIDAPTPQLAAKLIDDTIAAERNGLDGRVVFDSRGIAAQKDGKIDGYGWYDQAIRDGAAFVKAKTKLTVVTDDREAVIPPRDVPAVAAYCGWYSLRNYVPSCGFVRGAVGYHVASLELVSLHDPREKGWVANLIKDGVVATIGAVSEPYLSAFPRPEEFFPLLMTGRPTLAEVYWATCPMTSWKVTLIGDPLYRPYAKRPAVAITDLPQPLQDWAEKSEALPRTGR
ncbi:MAG TPA: TIGR03790 family protein [Tepidisphaeraceae bacterium]|jgi:uncharacterized protein (TIGR03790 family)